MGFNPKYVTIMIAIIILLSGCSISAGNKQNRMFSDSHDAYRHAILWSDFENASSFLKPDRQSVFKLDPIYSKIKVTAYDEKNFVVNSDNSRVEQTVQIRYYWVDQMIEKDITVNPTWEWDANSQIWYLTSGLPVFK